MDQVSARRLALQSAALMGSLVRPLTAGKAPARSKKRDQAQDHKAEQCDGYGRRVRRCDDLAAAVIRSSSSLKQLTHSAAAWKPSRCATDFLVLEDGIWCSILSYTDQTQFVHFRHLSRRFHRLTHITAAYPATVQLCIGNDEQQMQQVVDCLAVNSKSLACINHLQLTLPSHDSNDVAGHDADCARWTKLLHALVAAFNGNLLPAGRHLALDIQLDTSALDDEVDDDDADDDYASYECASRVACQHHYILCTSFNHLREFVMSPEVRWLDDLGLFSEVALASASSLQVLDIAIVHQQPAQALIDGLSLLSQLQRLTLRLAMYHPALRGRPIAYRQTDYAPLGRLSPTLQHLDLQVLDWSNATCTPALMTLTERLPALVLESDLTRTIDAGCFRSTRSGGQLGSTRGDACAIASLPATALRTADDMHINHRNRMHSGGNWRLSAQQITPARASATA